MYKRFKWNPIIRYDDWVWHNGRNIPKGSKTFVGSMMELFGEWVEPEWLQLIFDYCESASTHTFLFLTKKPENLIKWSPFPKNCWIGVSATNVVMADIALKNLYDIKATVKFLSLEPLLSWQHSIPTSFPPHLDWLILGSRTQPTRHPKLLEVAEIIEDANRAGIPLFIKEPLASHIGIQRQEMPK
ncbi:hypothetical protein LCGC14_0384660 [marine sediment metagenome]|uniref:DUF5131 family protein n=1 Tax=marine sediment metagenome TaxID=412755 RepID=A0A0F9T6Z5_9ZZZZ